MEKQSIIIDLILFAMMKLKKLLWEKTQKLTELVINFNYQT